MQQKILLNAEEENTIRDYLKNTRHVFLSALRTNHSEEWVLSLGHLLNHDREVYYYRVNQNSLMPFFKSLADAVFRENIGRNPMFKSMETTPPDILATILTGYTERLFSQGTSPLIILSGIEQVMRNDEKKALDCMLRYWHPLQFILVGTKLPSNLESKPDIQIIES